jgi:hypothetical protein
MFNPNRFAAENDTRIEELISHKVGSFFFPDKYILGNLFIPHPSPQQLTPEPTTFGTRLSVIEFKSGIEIDVRL